MLMPPTPQRSFTDIAEVLQFYLSYSPPDHALGKSIEWRLFREYGYPDPVLDLGCGDGVFAQMVFDRPLMAGIDILPGRVRKAHAAGVHRLPVTGDASHMPFQSGYFATVFSGCAMEHVLAMPEMLHEIERVLQPGGRLITTVPSGYFSSYLFVPKLLRQWGFAGLAERYKALITRLLTIAHMYHRERWVVLLQEAGLELVEARHFMPRPTMELFDKLLIVGNLLQPLRWLLRPTPLHDRYVAWLRGKLLPHVLADGPTGGVLLLVAEKPSV